MICGRGLPLSCSKEMGDLSACGNAPTVLGSLVDCGSSAHFSGLASGHRGLAQHLKPPRAYRAMTSDSLI